MSLLSLTAATIGLITPLALTFTHAVFPLSNALFKIYPNEKEGILDKKFANLVNKKTCYQISKKIGLDKYIFVGDSQKKLDKKNFSKKSMKNLSLEGIKILNKIFNEIC